MLVIRLTRKGKKNQPFFKVVVIDKRRSSKGGRAVEVLGYVDPLTKRKHLKKERILYWLKCGAQPSATMNNLLIQEKIIEGKKIHVSKIHPVKSAESGVAPEAQQFNGVKKSKLAKIETAKAEKISTSVIASTSVTEETPEEPTTPKG